MDTMHTKVICIDHPIILNNSTCIYCGIALGKNNKNKEHVIGRKFVPKGSLNNNWNLIVQSCIKCNTKKSALEDDISAITMQPSTSGIYADNEDLLRDESIRKGNKSISKLTGKPVAESYSNPELKIPFTQDLDITLSMTTPPQIILTRIYELAYMQIMAFFYYLIFNQDTKKGSFWPGEFFPLLYALRSNWGNEVHTAFMNTVVSWDLRFVGNTANDYFKWAIRKHPSETCWSWALEWNKNHRVIGFFGNQDISIETKSKIPKLSPDYFSGNSKEYIAIKMDKSLEENDDVMFYVNERI